MEFDLTETDTQLENANTRNKQNSQVELQSVDTPVDLVCGSSSMERVNPQDLGIAVISSLVLLFFPQFIYFS